jgi:uncharacterized protein
MLPDGIYRGWVHHQRHLPKNHEFQYPLAMLMLDLDELQSHFKRSRFWSLERFNLISFYRKDYLQSDQTDLKQAVVELIQQRSGESFSGTVKILTHPRYLGFIFNPVTFYFCYEQQQLKFIVAEINNTPWNERYAYVLKVNQQQNQPWRFDFDKQFHISPFMPMDIQYHWRFQLEQDAININMVLLREGERQFDATLQADFQPMTARSMRWLPIRYPLQTLRVVMRIYWQALRLWGKHTPSFSHPDQQADTVTQPVIPNGEDK